MADPKLNKAGSTDLLSLARTSSLPELIAALEEERTLNEGSSPVPPRANQIARLILSKAILLIRLGTQAELADATVEVVRALAGPKGELLAERFPQAHRLLTGASVSLRAATPPSSSGGELAVLRLWKGKARRAVKMVLDSEGEQISRAEIRRRLRVDESYLSHLLADLEAAGLLVRIRDGRTVTVHLGPAGRSDHVRKFLEAHDPPGKNEVVREAQALFHAILTEHFTGMRLALAPEVSGRDLLEKQFDDLRYGLIVAETEIQETIASHTHVACRIRVSGRMQMGPDDGKFVDHPLVWVAVIERDEIVAVETWSSLTGSLRPARQGTEVPPASSAIEFGMAPDTLIFTLMEHESLQLDSKLTDLLQSPGEGGTIAPEEHVLGQWTEKYSKDLRRRRTE